MAREAPKIEGGRASARAGLQATLLFAAAALILFLTHLPFLRLPYYWDELGQFIPAALDIFQRGLWIPRSTVPNIHPPGLMAYLAAAWSLFGCSIVVTRAAMLVVGSATVLAAFLLAFRLCDRRRGPAILATVFLMASPLFYTQAMLAELDLPAALFTLLVLLLFLEDRFRAAALASIALVLVKETGLVVPVILGGWLALTGKRRTALWFALPALALGGWLFALWRVSGNVAGNSGFAEFNLLYPLHPVRLAVALLRRAIYLFLENFHWIGWVAVALAWKRSRLFRNRPWAVVATVGVAQTLAVTVFGGATLERYLMPVLPLIYIAMAAALWAAPPRRARFAAAALTAGLLASWFWSAPLPQPFENNLALVDFVRVQQDAARFVESRYPGQRVATAWPLTGALRRPELGYVQRRVLVKEMAGFGPSALAELKPGSFGVMVLFSREWEPDWDPRRLPLLRGLAQRYYGYESQVPPAEAARRFGFERVARWERGGQWAEALAPR